MKNKTYVMMPVDGPSLITAQNTASFHPLNSAAVSQSFKTEVSVSDLRGVEPATGTLLEIDADYVRVERPEGISGYSKSYKPARLTAAGGILAARIDVTAPMISKLKLAWARAVWNAALKDNKDFGDAPERMLAYAELGLTSEVEAVSLRAVLSEMIGLNGVPTGKTKEVVQRVPRYGTARAFPIFGKEETGWWSVPEVVEKNVYRRATLKEAWAINAILYAADTRRPTVWSCGNFTRNVLGQDYIYQQERDFKALIAGQELKPRTALQAVADQMRFMMMRIDYND